MFLQDPPPSPYELRFRMFDIPIRVNPWFWGIAALMGLSSANLNAGGLVLMQSVVPWIAAVFISILLHELGHAMTGRMFGSSRVHIVLYSMGGMAVGATGRTTAQRIQVIAAGPGMNILLGIPFFILAARTEHGANFLVYMAPILRGPILWLYELMGESWIQLRNPFLINFVMDMVYVNFFWAFMNLLPVFPLDGGQITSEVITARNPYNGRDLVHKIGMVAAITVALLFLVSGKTFIVFLFGYLAYMNYQYLKQGSRW